MTTFNLTCEAVEATLADYLDETLEPWVHTAIEEHLAGCSRCNALAHELRSIAREIAALPALLPEGDVWPKVAARIGAPGIVSEPADESVPSEPALERVVFSSDSFLSVSEEPEAPEEPLVLTPDSPVITSDPPPLTSEPVLARGPSLPTRETPAVTKEPVVPTKEKPALTSEREVPRSEPPSVPHDTPLPTPAPLTVTREPALRSTSDPVTTTAPAHPLAARREKRWGPLQISLAAAALVLVTATASSLLTVRLLGRAGTPSVASTTSTPTAPGEKPPSSQNQSSANQPSSATRLSSGTQPSGASQPSGDEPPADPSAGGPSTDRRPVEPGLPNPTPVVASALTASAAAAPIVTPSPEHIVYDKEINTLSRIVRRKKSRLDPSTVTVIDKNLRAVDSASDQIRAALKDDPSNPLLEAQASRALEMKVELLRRAAMMRSTTSL